MSQTLGQQLLEVDRRRAWAQAARHGRCVVCGAPHPRGHHIVTQQLIRRTAKTQAQADDWLWDLRNMLPLCDRHHDRHHNRMRPISWEVLTAHQPQVLRFASELGLSWWLERTYPRTRGQAPG